MSRSLATLAVLLFLCACGDPRESFSGVYAVAGTATLTVGDYREEEQIEDTLEIVADAFNGERLFIDFHCGLSGKVDSEDTFFVDVKACPASKADGCTFKTTFDGGAGRLKEGPTLNLRLEGNLSATCPEGTATARLTFNVSGKQTSRSFSNERSALPKANAALRRALGLREGPAVHGAGAPPRP